MKAALIFFACALLVVATGVALLSWDSPAYRRTNPETDDAYAAGETRPISARVEGYVTSLPIDDNQVVRAGALIATIEASDYEAQAQQARAQEAVSQGNLDSIIARRHQLEQQVDQAAAMLQSQQAGLIQTGPNARRQRALAPTDVGLQRSVDQAVAAERATFAQIESAQAALASEQRQLDVDTAQVQQAQAELAASRANARLAEITLGWTRITAPVDGTLGPRQVRTGALLNTGSVVVDETPLDRVWVNANYTERQVGNIRLGQPARLRFDSFPHAVLDGHVVGISPATGAQFSQLVPDNVTGNYTKVVQRVPVKIAIDWNGSPLLGQIRPGMSVKATVTTDGGPARAPWTIR